MSPAAFVAVDELYAGIFEHFADRRNVVGIGVRSRKHFLALRFRILTRRGPRLGIWNHGTRRIFGRGLNGEPIDSRGF